MPFLGVVELLFCILIASMASISPPPWIVGRLVRGVLNDSRCHHPPCALRDRGLKHLQKRSRLFLVCVEAWESFGNDGQTVVSYWWARQVVALWGASVRVGKIVGATHVADVEGRRFPHPPRSLKKNGEDNRFQCERNLPSSHCVCSYDLEILPWAMVVALGKRLCYCITECPLEFSGRAWTLSENGGLKFS